MQPTAQRPGKSQTAVNLDSAVCHQRHEDEYQGQTHSPSPYPSNFRGPRHHDSVGNCGGQPNERRYIYGAAGPFWFYAILCGWEISLQSKPNKYVTLFLSNLKWLTNTNLRGLTGRLQGLLLTFTHRLGGKWSSWGQLVSDKQNLKARREIVPTVHWRAAAETCGGIHFICSQTFLKTKQCGLRYVSHCLFSNLQQVCLIHASCLHSGLDKSQGLNAAAWLISEGNIFTGNMSGFGSNAVSLKSDVNMSKSCTTRRFELNKSTNYWTTWAPAVRKYLSTLLQMTRKAQKSLFIVLCTITRKLNTQTQQTLITNV